MAGSGKRLLQGVVTLLAVVPIVAGLGGIVLGPRMAAPMPIVPLAVDSQWAYLSGLLMGIGLGFWSTVPSIETKGGRFRLLALIVMLGGLGRASSYWFLGPPDLPMLGGLVIELAVMPVLMLWQALVARAGRRVAATAPPADKSVPGGAIAVGP